MNLAREMGTYAARLAEGASENAQLLGLIGAFTLAREEIRAMAK